MNTIAEKRMCSWKKQSSFTCIPLHFPQTLSWKFQLFQVRRHHESWDCQYLPIHYPQDLQMSCSMPWPVSSPSLSWHASPENKRDNLWFGKKDFHFRHDLITPMNNQSIKKQEGKLTVYLLFYIPTSKSQPNA